jgi:MFS transporter, DHA1 family, tetracycline resistance protein
MSKTQKRSLSSLYFAYFSDYFSWGAAIAFLASYITNGNTPFKTLLWDADISLGIAYAAFPIGEVIGSPILGDLSDWIGRKKVLVWGLWASILSMTLCAWALWEGNFLLFLFAQLLVGFFSGKQALAQAAIVEIHAGTKGQKLAFLSVLGGIAWVSGPFFGGILMTEPFISYGGFIWPSLLACLIYGVTLLATHYLFIDHYIPKQGDLSPLKFMKGIGDIFVLTWKESLFSIFILNLLGWYLLAVSLSQFLISRFNLTESEIGFFNNYSGLCFILGGVIGTAWILHRWKAKSVLFWTLLFASMGLFLLVGTERVIELWTYLAIPAFTEAWVYPAYQTVLSDHANSNNQGKLFGLIGASNGVCQFAAILILGGISSQTSILIAALLFLSSAALLPAMIRKKMKKAHKSLFPTENLEYALPAESSGDSLPVYRSNDKAQNA